MLRILLVFLILLNGILAGQDISSFSPNKWHTRFLKQNITWEWQTDFLYASDLSSQPGIRVENTFSSFLWTPANAKERWRDENKLDGSFFYRSGALRYGIFIDSWYQNDRQATITNRYSRHSLGISLDYQVNPSANLIPYAAYQRSENRANIDWGWDLGVKADFRDIELGDYRSDILLESDLDVFPQRRNTANSLDVSFKSRFSRVASDSLSIQYGIENQEFFSANGNDLINVEINNRNLTNILLYTLSNRSMFELRTYLISETISDNTSLISGTGDAQRLNERDKLRFENRLNFRYVHSRFLMLLGIQAFQEVQDNTGTLTDNKSLQTALKSNFIYTIGSADRLELQLSLVKYQYDTPDEQNKDDRDELRFVGLLEYSHRFNPLLLFSAELYVNLLHKIYLFEERSANNNWNRLVRLDARVRYKNAGFINALYTQVLANYTVYDFDELFPESRSIIFRRYSISDSVWIPLFDNLALGFHGRLELEDRGNFYKQDFGQSILESARVHHADVYLRMKSLLKFRFESGLNWYRRLGWLHVPERELVRNIVKLSPYIRMIYPLYDRLRFVAYASISFLNDKNRQRVNYTTGKLNLYYVF